MVLIGYNHRLYVVMVPDILVAPKVVGGRTAPGPIGGEGISRMEFAHEIRACRWRELGPDRVLEGAISAAGSGDEVGTKTTSQRG